MVIVLFWLFRKIFIVSLIIGRPWSTVKSFLRWAIERGHIENLPRSGRPEKLTKRERRHIWRTIKRNRKLTREQPRDECAPDVSLATIASSSRSHLLEKERCATPRKRVGSASVATVLIYGNRDLDSLRRE